MGTNLAVVTSTMGRHLQTLLKAKMPQNQKDWKQEGLFDFSYQLLFKYDKTHASHASPTRTLN